MRTKVKMWGNSQAIIIPREVLQEADVAVDDILDVKVSNGMIMLVKPFRHRTLEERAAEYGGRLDLDGNLTGVNRAEERFGSERGDCSEGIFED